MNSEQKPPEREPSLLDFIKSRLKFWDRGQKIELKAYRLPAVPPNEDELHPPRPDLHAQPAAPGVKAPRGEWPWRSLVALAFALLGQRSFELSPNRTAIPGLVFYGFGLAWLILAILRREWSPAPLPEKETRAENMRVRRLPLILGILFSILAFLTLGGNLFTGLNVTLWVLAIIFLGWAFWQRAGDQRTAWQRVKGFFTGESWQLKVTRWTLLILVVAGVVIFFRLYNLGGVPSEPTSDHAEKILDLYDITQGQTHIFFVRNSGREGFQMYWSILMSWIFKTGLTFLTLKIGTVLLGLASLPFMYLLGKELGGRRIGLLAVFFTGIAYWPNVISRAGLRFPLAPLFTAIVLYYLLRGLRRQNRNDFILAGLALGLGLHGYSSFRIMPVVVVVIFGLYWLHTRSKDTLRKAVMWLLIIVSTSLVVFLPLFRYFVDNPESVMMRSLTRLTGVEQPLPGPVLQIFLSNFWNALRMFNWDDGQVWPHSIPLRPALDVVCGALFVIGVVLLIARYIRQRHWQDLFLVISIPLLQLPSTLALAFPVENPNTYRTGGAIISTFLIVSIALDGLVTAILRYKHPGVSGLPEADPSSLSQQGLPKSSFTRTALAWLLVLVLAGWSAFQNYDLVFNQFSSQYTASSWNSSEMGDVIKYFGLTYGSTDNAWIVPVPYWVDTRLPGVWAGIPDRDFAVWPDNFNSTLEVQGPKLFIVSVTDPTSLPQLEALYPQGTASLYVSKTNQEGKNFYIFFVPAAKAN